MRSILAGGCLEGDNSVGAKDMQKQRILIFIAVAVVITAADLATKTWAERSLKPKGPVTVIQGYLDFKYGENEGAAFGLGSSTKWGPPLLAAVSIGAVFFLVYLAVRIKERPVLMALSLGLVLGGVLGNLHDRLLNDSKVRDFIDAHYGNSHWPLFNIADSGITVGVILLVLISFFPGKKVGPKKKAPKPA